MDTSGFIFRKKKIFLPDSRKSLCLQLLKYVNWLNEYLGIRSSFIEIEKLNKRVRFNKKYISLKKM